jgi:hypothetical protein
MSRVTFSPRNLRLLTEPRQREREIRARNYFLAIRIESTMCVCDHSIILDGQCSRDVDRNSRDSPATVLNGSLWITTDRRVCTFSRDNVDHSDVELSRGDALSCWLARIHLYLRGRRRNFADNMADTTPGFSTRHSDTLSLSLSLSFSPYFSFRRLVARTAFILFPPFPRRREPPTCPAK